MAVNVSRGLSTVTSVQFYKMVTLVAVGMAVSTVGADWVRNNVVDFDVPFQDVVYSLAMVVLVRSLLSGRDAMMVATGAGVGVAFGAAEEVGVV